MTLYLFIMPSHLIGGGIKQCFCLSCKVYVGPKSITERPRKTKIGTEIAHILRDSDTTFKVKVTRPLYSSVALTCKTAAVVSVGTKSEHEIYQPTWELNPGSSDRLSTASGQCALCLSHLSHRGRSISVGLSQYLSPYLWESLTSISV